MNLTVITYLSYLAISIAMTIWVARTLHKNGAVFLVEALQGNEELAASINHLLVVGFYLINLGYVSLMLRMDTHPTTVAMSMEFLSGKIGFVLLVLGVMHFFNLYVFSRIRQSARLNRVAVTSDLKMGIAKA